MKTITDEIEPNHNIDNYGEDKSKRDYRRMWDEKLQQME